VLQSEIQLELLGCVDAIIDVVVCLLRRIIHYALVWSSTRSRVS